MSEVISFRLNPDNPREAQALYVLRTKQSEGFSSRSVMTDALIGMVTRKEEDKSFSREEISLALKHVSDLLEQINGRSQSQVQQPRPQVAELNEIFLNSIKVAAKPGLSQI